MASTSALETSVDSAKVAVVAVSLSPDTLPSPRLAESNSAVIRRMYTEFQPVYALISPHIAAVSCARIVVVALSTLVEFTALVTLTGVRVAGAHGAQVRTRTDHLGATTLTGHVVTPVLCAQISIATVLWC